MAQGDAPSRSRHPGAHYPRICARASPFVAWGAPDLEVARRYATRGGTSARTRVAPRLSCAGRSGASTPLSEPHQVGGRELDLQAAPPGRDVDRGPRGRRVVDDRRQRSPGAQRADPAEHVPRRPLGVGRCRDRRPTPTQRVGDRLEVDLGIGRDDRDPEAPIDGDDDGLEHPRGVDPQRLDGLKRIAATALAKRGAWVVRIFMHFMRDPGAPCGLDRARPLCAHGAIVGYAPRDRWSPPPPHSRVGAASDMRPSMKVAAHATATRRT